jgi:hypothetical protein
MAHEMAHVIGNLEHIQDPTPDLMDVLQSGSIQDVGHAMDGYLNPSQCQSILSYP